ncbi:MAG: uncharacterized protein QOE41_1306, partial [Mycobacterium sp.]|nr:uncharacterized protein [Mycobacterium sp.]
LILMFFPSAVVRAVVRKATIVRLLGDDRPRTLAIAAVLGAASSSCSYAAVALARSLIRTGAKLHRSPQHLSQMLRRKDNAGAARHLLCLDRARPAMSPNCSLGQPVSSHASATRR